MELTRWSAVNLHLSGTCTPPGLRGGQVRSQLTLPTLDMNCLTLSLPSGRRLQPIGAITWIVSSPPAADSWTLNNTILSHEHKSLSTCFLHYILNTFKFWIHRVTTYNVIVYSSNLSLFFSVLYAFILPFLHLLNCCLPIFHVAPSHWEKFHLNVLFSGKGNKDYSDDMLKQSCCPNYYFMTA